MPTEFNLAKLFSAVAAAVPEREAFVWRDRRITYAELEARSNRLANFLVEGGLGPTAERSSLEPWQSGQHQLGLYLRNGNEYVEGMVGAFKARVAPFNLNFRYVEEELLHLFRDSGATALIYAAEFAPTLARVLDQLPQLLVLIQVDDGSGHELLSGALDYESVLAGQSTVVPPCDPSPDDLYVLYTGGTTGMPKGVLWRQHDIFMAAMGGRPHGGGPAHESYESVVDAAVAGNGGARTMLTAPLMHGASQWTLFGGFTGGGTAVLPDVVDHIDAADVWQTVAREGVRVVPLVGDAVARPLLEELERGDYDLPSLFLVTNGGAALNPVLKERFLAALPDILVWDAVGSSETGYQAGHASATGSVATTGTFDPDSATVVADDTLSTLVEPGHQTAGWLARRGNVPLGYLGDPDKSARTFPVINGDRYSVPGDRARLLADGRIELLGRDSATINSGGEKIFAEEVESALSQHPDVVDAIVVGRPSERWGQEVVALIVTREGCKATENDLLEHAGTHLARFKLPKAFVFLPKLERSPSGKADYRWAKQQAVAAAQ